MASVAQLELLYQIAFLYLKETENRKHCYSNQPSISIYSVATSQQTDSQMSYFLCIGYPILQNPWSLLQNMKLVSRSWWSSTRMDMSTVERERYLTPDLGFSVWYLTSTDRILPWPGNFMFRKNKQWISDRFVPSSRMSESQYLVTCGWRVQRQCPASL